jgi:hypothetical protein
MYLKRPLYALLSIVGVATSVLVGRGLMGADSPASRINVEFEAGQPGLQRGDQEYILGLPVGEVGKPLLRSNRAIVPVLLAANNNVLGEHGQVFSIFPQIKRSLVTTASTPSSIPCRPRPAHPDSEVFLRRSGSIFRWEQTK